MSDWHIDTNVISELSRSKPDPRVASFLYRNPSLVLSVVTLHELEFGIAVAPKPQRAKLARWFEGLLRAFEGRVLEATTAIWREAAVLRAEEQNRGRVLAPLDSLIAATARANDIGLATRNVTDFQTLGLELINPWHEA